MNKTPKMSVLINGQIAATWSGRVEKCRGCAAEIGWALTEHGKWTPFDPDEHTTSHFATCPKVIEFRRKK